MKRTNPTVTTLIFFVSGSSIFLLFLPTMGASVQQTGKRSAKKTTLQAPIRYRVEENKGPHKPQRLLTLKPKPKMGKRGATAKTKKSQVAPERTQKEFLEQFKKETDKIWADKATQENKFIKEAVAGVGENLTPAAQRDIVSKFFPSLFIELYEQLYKDMYIKNFDTEPEEEHVAKVAQEQYDRQQKSSSGTAAPTVSIKPATSGKAETKPGCCVIL